MPYRRLPNTDAARIRALKAAFEKGEQQEINTIAYPFPLKQKVGFFIPKLEAAMGNSTLAREMQSNSSHKFSKHTKKTRLYLSHFIQILNFSIARGELKSSARSFYGLDENSSKVPSLLSEQDILEWGQKIIDGELNRINNGGGSAIYSPSIALVRVNYETFKENYTGQKRLQNNTARESSNVAQLRDDADAFILGIWNDVERYFEKEKDEEKKRSMCEEYGLTYIYRKGEKDKIIRRRKEAEKNT